MGEGEGRASSMSSERARQKWRKLFAGVNAVKLEATTAATSGSRRFSSPASAVSLSIRSDEVVVTPSATSSETQYHSCTDAEQRSPQRSISMETNSFSPLDVQQSNAGNENSKPCCRRDGLKQKVLEWIFVIANFIVELLSMVFDQLSSQRKSVFLPVCMGMSISAVLICLFELVYKIRKEKANWEKKGLFPWYYHPSGVRFGSFADVVGLACACGQCTLTAINYSLFREHGNIPIKISIWPSIFAFGQLCSKMWGNSSRVFTSENHILPT